MGEIIKLPINGAEAMPLSCEVCAEWDALAAHFFVYSDGSFRCVQCGTSYVFNNGEDG